MSTPHVVFYNFTISDKKGKLLESSGSQTSSYIETKGQVFPAIENFLKTAISGEKKQIELTPQDAYGAYKDALVIDVPKLKFKTPVTIDQRINIVTPSGKKRLMRVVDFNSDSVILDGNHEFAGLDIQVKVELIMKRPASVSELKSGEVQGPTV